MSPGRHRAAPTPPATDGSAAAPPPVPTVVLAPSQEDPAAIGASRLIGGRWGAHAGGPTSRWWTPIRIVLALTVLVTVFGYLQKSPCLTHPYSNDYQYTRVCYTDTYALYTAEGLNARRTATGGVTGRLSVPYRDHPVEYPPIIGGLMWAAAELTAFVHPGAADVNGIHNTTFFNLTALGLAICALISTWTVAKLAGRRRVWDAAMVAASPVLLMHAFTNWDLVAVALTGLGLWAWSRGSPVWAGALLGVGVATKLYPLFVLLALLMLCARAGLWRSAAKAVGAAAAALVVCYLPAVLVSKSFSFPNNSCAAAHPLSGWRWFFSLSQTRGADWGSVWLVGQHVFKNDFFGRSLNTSVACGAAPTALNVYSGALVLLVVVGVGALVALAPRRPRVPQIAFLLVAGFIVFNKVDSPQYALWLVPLAVLAHPRWPSILAWQATEVLLGVANLYTLIALDPGGNHGLPIDTYLDALVLRDVALFALMGLVVWEAMVPRRDVVRRDGVDDPAGGELDGAPDAYYLASAATLA
jgi:uncharacterized membrane protein